MDRTALLTIFLLGGAMLVGLMALGWRGLKRRQADIVAPPIAPEDPGDNLGSFLGKYVATTMANEPLKRVAVHGLGFRGSVVVTASQNGLLLNIAGAPEVWISRAAIRGMRRATWAIDRAVETDGLHVVAWTLGDRDVDTYLRIADPASFDEAVTQIIKRQSQ